MDDLLPASAWPRLDPPLLTRLPRPPTIHDQSNLPASKRFADTLFPTLQDEVDQVDFEEERWYTQMHETRGFGFSWLVPLGRQNTQEEDQESSYTNSPPAASPLLVTDDPGAEPDAEGAGGGGEVDLDAEIEDADQNATGSEDDDDNDGEDAAEDEEASGGDDMNGATASPNASVVDDQRGTSTDGAEGEGEMSEASMEI